MSRKHTMRGVIESPRDWYVTVVIDCPWEPDDRERDCRMVEDDGTPLDGCALIDWLDADPGGFTLAFHAKGPVDLPALGRCEWRGNDDWPTFVVDEGGDDE